MKLISLGTPTEKIVAGDTTLINSIKSFHIK